MILDTYRLKVYIVYEICMDQFEARYPNFWVSFCVNIHSWFVNGITLKQRITTIMNGFQIWIWFLVRASIYLISHCYLHYLLLDTYCSIVYSFRRMTNQGVLTPWKNQKYNSESTILVGDYKYQQYFTAGACQSIIFTTNTVASIGSKVVATRKVVCGSGV